jgi:hypothetical protein
VDWFHYDVNAEMPVIVAVNPGTANLTHQWTFDDGTANDGIGNANGTLRGGANVENKALQTTLAGQYLELPVNSLGITTYSSLSMEAWFTSKSGANTGNTMLCYLGNTVNNMGSNGCFISIARADNISRTAISCGNLTAPWNAESYVNSTEIEDGKLHQVVSVITATDISYYIDGVSVGTAALNSGNSLANIILNYAYLAKSGYGSDPTWLGSIDKFSLYNKALSGGEILYLYQYGTTTDTQKTKTDKLNVSPNPAVDYITVSGISGNANVEIIDLQGRVLMSVRNVISNQQIGVGDLASGTYLVKISTQEETVMKKMLRG